jgi:hypothetical protein
MEGRVAFMPLPSLCSPFEHVHIRSKKEWRNVMPQSHGTAICADESIYLCVYVSMCLYVCKCMLDVCNNVRMYGAELSNT